MSIHPANGPAFGLANGHAVGTEAASEPQSQSNHWRVQVDPLDA